jgi:hypothetical protein
MTDLELLQRFEPIVRYTQGELFFPCGVDQYAAHSSLWLRTPDGKDQQLVSPGKLTLEGLARHHEAPAGHTLYMNLVEEPLSGLAYQRWRIRPDRPIFQSIGRLARVPLVYRIVDSFFDLTFLVRGQVPGGFAAAAQIHYEALQQLDPRRVYHGRVVRDKGWIVLQYLFFYSMNDWRSSFFGVNDHEADWEQVFVYVYEDEQNELTPQWVAYASHDFKGDDLRRRWDDPLLDTVGTHPVVYAGAGSHASYFERGEYTVGIEPPAVKRIERFFEQAQHFWYDQLGMGRLDQPTRDGARRPLLSIPHIDFARGDGKSIGPDQSEPWSPVLISDDVPWVDKYRGLWGLDTRDFIGGERAPSGPKYNRDGSMRQSWYDPLGWAGMDKVAPPPEIPGRLTARVAELEQQMDALGGQISERRANVERLDLDLTALRSSNYGEALAKELDGLASSEHQALDALQRARLAADEKIRALRSLQGRIAAGEVSSPTGHLHSVHHPEPPPPPHSRLVDIWAALSGALAILAVAFLVVSQPNNWLALILGVLLIFGAIDAVTRGRLTNYLLSAAIILAIIAGFILVIEFWLAMLVIAIVAVVIFMIVDNLRELMHS